MKKSLEALCRQCRTLAIPVCECGLLATKHSDSGLVLYSDNLTKVSLTNVWRDLEGLVIWLEETDLLAKSRVSTVSDIHFTER